MLCLISFFFLFINPCFSEEKTFFSEIDKKPKKIREKVLERRLQFISRRRMDIKIEDTVKTYLKFNYKNSKRKINFIISLLNRVSEGKEVDIERKILSSAISFCKRIQCIFLLASLPEIKNSEIVDKNIRAEMLERLLDFRNYSPDIARSSFLLELFDQLINDDKKNLKKVLLLVSQYGKYKFMDKKISEYKKEFSNEGWFRYRECFLFIIKNQYEKLKACSANADKNDGWIKFLYFYSIFLQDEKIKNEDIEKFSSMFGDNEKSWVIVFKIFLLGNGTKEMFSGLDLNNIVKVYTLGYYFLIINNSYHMFKGKELEELMEKYNKKFENSLFEQVLKGQVSGEKLAEYFGKNSLFYQFYINTHKK